MAAHNITRPITRKEFPLHRFFEVPSACSAQYVPGDVLIRDGGWVEVSEAAQVYWERFGKIVHHFKKRLDEGDSSNLQEELKELLSCRDLSKLPVALQKSSTKVMGAAKADRG